MATSTVVIVGGNSRAARQLVDTFLSRPDCPSLRVLVSPQGVEALEEAFPLLTSPPHFIRSANLMDKETLSLVFPSSSVVVYNSPSINQNEVVMAISTIEAAKKAGVRFFIFCSILHPMRSKLVTHTNKLKIEEYLVESRINYCILQPTHFMQNVSLGHVLRTGKIPLGFSEMIEHGFVDLRDFASVLRQIILHPMRHNRATYEIVGENCTYLEVALVLQEALGQEVQCEQIPADRYIAMLKEGNVIQSEYAEDAMERIIVYHNRWGLTGNSNILRWLLGHEPRDWRKYVTEMFSDV